jgi:hypothetical protein
MRAARLLAASSAMLVSWGSAHGAVLWFDETGGGGGYPAFNDLEQAYSTFLGTTGQTITFNDLAEGTLPSNQYTGVTFSNTAHAPRAGDSGVRPEGGEIVQPLTGYDGAYRPDGDAVFIKFSNNLQGSPLTIDFATPVSSFGAFVGTEAEDNVHTLTVVAYDAAGQSLGMHTVQSWLWESDPAAQNYESFLGVRSAEGLISRITIKNDSQARYANALILDNVTFTGDSVVPEPASCLLIAGAGLVLMGARRGHWTLVSASR